jgi:hypothetical protein
MALRDLLNGTEQVAKDGGLDFDTEQVATATVATFATVEQAQDRTLVELSTVALAKLRDPKTGEVVPRVLAMAEPLPSEEFKAQLVSFRPKRSPKEIPLVEILCPASSGGMKGLVFKVGQVPGLIRALQQAQAGAVERGLIGKPVGQWRAPEKQRAQPGLTWP